MRIQNTTKGVLPVYPWKIKNFGRALWARLDGSPYLNNDPNYRIPPEKILELLPKLPPEERDAVEMFVLAAKLEDEIAEILGISQAAVSYKLKRAFLRIRFMASLPELHPDEVERDLADILSETDRKILVMLLDGSWSQSGIAAELRRPKTFVRDRILRMAQVLDPVLHEKYVTFLSMLRGNYNTRRETSAGPRSGPYMRKAQRWAGPFVPIELWFRDSLVYAVDT